METIEIIYKSTKNGNMDLLKRKMQDEDIMVNDKIIFFTTLFVDTMCPYWTENPEVILWFLREYLSWVRPRNIKEKYQWFYDELYELMDKLENQLSGE